MLRLQVGQEPQSIFQRHITRHRLLCSNLLHVLQCHRGWELDRDVSSLLSAVDTPPTTYGMEWSTRYMIYIPTGNC